jgi:hypothetical protein
MHFQMALMRVLSAGTAKAERQQGRGHPKAAILGDLVVATASVYLHLLPLMNLTWAGPMRRGRHTTPHTGTSYYLYE